MRNYVAKALAVIYGREGACPLRHLPRSEAMD